MAEIDPGESSRMIHCPRWALLALPLFVITQAAFAAAAEDNCSLIIHVTGFRNSKGVLGAELFTSSNGWPEDYKKSFRHEHFPIDGDHATARFDHIPAGRYGVVVLHDENQNMKLDRNFMGIPTEGFGFANNPRVFLSAPPIEKATIPVTCPETTTDIHLIYK
jgi:uncharacterized protein (DUF2141 family)